MPRPKKAELAEAAHIIAGSLSKSFTAKDEKSAKRYQADRRRLEPFLENVAAIDRLPDETIEALRGDHSKEAHRVVLAHLEFYAIQYERPRPEGAEELEKSAAWELIEALDAYSKKRGEESHA